LVVAIHVAPGSRIPVRAVEAVDAEAGKGLIGDRYHGTKHRPRVSVLPGRHPQKPHRRRRRDSHNARCPARHRRR
jgi:hypothetical protein